MRLDDSHQMQQDRKVSYMNEIRNKTQLPKLEIFLAPTESRRPSSLKPNNPNDVESMHNVIQNTWAAFSTMSDVQRNQLLRGLISRCSSKEIDFICTSLNLQTRHLQNLKQTVDLNDLNTLYFQSRPKKKSNYTKTHEPMSIQGHKKSLKSENTHAPGNKFSAFSPSLGIETDDIENLIDDRSDLNHPDFLQKDSHFDANMYIKLLNSTADHNIIHAHLQNAGEGMTKKFVEYVTARIRKLHLIMKSFKLIACDSDIGSAMNTLKNCVSQILNAAHVSLFTFNESTSQVTAECSTWLKQGEKIEIDRIFCGHLVLLKSESVNQYNIKSTENWDSFEQHYSKHKIDPECIISIPVVNDHGRISGMIEVINKGAGLAPYFSAEDEYMLQTMINIWAMLLTHHSIREESLKKTDDIKILLTTASLMSSELELEGGNILNLQNAT
ncbi:hypothetical protein HK098_007433 [Nowakowskiella sp. JEL0407]|nr:hypothetical protein HK098_007433 [Nowakowskiella sp. JEL0407]